MKNFLTTGQVAELYGVNPKTVTRWANSGLVRATLTPGGRWRFHKDDVAKIIERQAKPRQERTSGASNDDN